MSFFPIGAFSKGPSNSWLEQSKVAAIFLDFFVLDFVFGISIAVFSAGNIFHLIFIRVALYLSFPISSFFIVNIWRPLYSKFNYSLIWAVFSLPCTFFKLRLLSGIILGKKIPEIFSLRRPTFVCPLYNCEAIFVSDGRSSHGWRYGDLHTWKKNHVAGHGARRHARWKKTADG